MPALCGFKIGGRGFNLSNIMKINITNTEAVNAAINKVAGKATTHVHTGPQVQREAEVLYQKLCRNLPKKLLVGSFLRLSSRPSLPKAYGARKVIHTEIEVEICASGLFVVEIKKCEDWACSTPYGGAQAVLPEPVKVHLKNVLYQKEVRL
jgi:hypothetical protein